MSNHPNPCISMLSTPHIKGWYSDTAVLLFEYLKDEKTQLYWIVHFVKDVYGISFLKDDNLGLHGILND